MQTQASQTPRPTTVRPMSGEAMAPMQAGSPLRVVMNGARLDIQASVDLAGPQAAQGDADQVRRYLGNDGRGRGQRCGRVKEAAN